MKLRPNTKKMEWLLKGNKELAFKIITVILIPAVIVFSLGIGNVKIPFDGMIGIFTGENNEVYKNIILKLRIPRIINGLICGAGLSVTGIIMQSVLRNPLAEPYMLGISSGAMTGAVIGIIAGGGVLVNVLSLLFSILTISFIYMVSKKEGELSSIKLLLNGFVVNSFLYSIVALMLSFSNGKIRDIIFWTMGDLSATNYMKLILICAIIIPIIVLFLRYSKELDLMSVNDEAAFYSGVDVDKIKKMAFIMGAVVTSVIVSVTGIIGFVGLVVPNVMRIITGNSHKKLLLYGACYGGVFLVAADTIGRSLLDSIEIPVGVITAIVGSPIFIYILKKRG